MSTNIATPALLLDARRAYHNLVTGTMPRVVIDQNGERVDYALANKQGLYAYIQQLEAQLAVACGGTPVPLAQFHPAGFTF